MDKAIHLSDVLKQLRKEPIKVTVVTDNLSLRRCLYSGRPTKEERLQKEFAVIRDPMTTQDVRVRFVPGQVMLADCLSGCFLYSRVDIVCIYHLFGISLI